MPKSQKPSLYNKQVDQSHYDFTTYVNQERWTAYFYQIKEVLQLIKDTGKKNPTVLDIGVGDRTVANVLQSQGALVKTLDIDPELQPDYVAALPSIPVQKKFDYMLCCQVLEHLAYEDSELTLKNMAQRCRYAVISVPHRGIFVSWTLKVWFWKTLRGFLYIKSWRQFDDSGQHYWELGVPGYSPKRFRDSLRRAKFEVLKDYRMSTFPFFHFFVVKSRF
jgi:hypothetical protein